MKVYVLVESWWDGRSYYTNASEDIYVYATEELALQHKKRHQMMIDKSQVEIEITCEEVITETDN